MPLVMSIMSYVFCVIFRMANSFVSIFDYKHELRERENLVPNLI